MPSIPPFLNVPHTVGVRITAVFGGGAGTGMHVLNFSTGTAAPTVSDAEACVSIVDDWVATNYTPLISSAWKIVKIEGFDRSNSAGPYFSLAVNYEGGLSGGPVMQEWAPLLLLGTNYQGRSHHGRFYALSPSPAWVQPGNYNIDHMDLLVGAMRVLRSGSESASLPLCVASPTTVDNYPVSGVTFSQRRTLQTRRRENFGG